jgi:hypothetical protein
VWITHEGVAAMRVMQMGMQYLMFQQEKMYEGTIAKENQVLEHKKYVDRLQEKLLEIKQKTIRYERLE